MRPRTAPAFLACTVAAATLGLAPLAEAQEAAPPQAQRTQADRAAIAPDPVNPDPANPDEVLALLDSEDYLDRRLALTAIVRSDEFDDETIRDLLQGGELSPDQRLALEAALFRRFADAPIGAMGISFAQIPDADRRGLIIGNVFDGFPAAEAGIIRVNDVIVSIDGVRLIDVLEGGLQTTNVNRAIRLVQTRVFSRKPGESMPVTLFRPAENGVDGEEIVADITLGDYQRLNNARQLQGDLLAQAYDVRLERLGIVRRPEPAEMPAGENFWPRANVGIPMRLSRSTIVSGPTPLVDVFNRLDPYAPRRSQDRIRNEFMTSTKQIARGNAVHAEIVVNGLRQRVVARDLNNMQVQNLRQAQQRQRTVGRAASRVQKASPVPVAGRAAALREDVRALTRAIARTTDPATRGRLEQRLDDTTAALDAIADELRARSETFSR